MKTKLCLLGSIVLALCAGGVVLSQDEVDWENYGKPVAEHNRYTHMEGNWKLVLRSPAPDGEKWTETKGEATYTWIMDKRFLHEEVKAEMMGASFEWMGILGYDTNLKKYTGVWVDNATTSTNTAQGTWDEKTSTLKFTGEHFNPQTAGNTKFQWNLVLKEKDQFRIEMFYGEGEGATKAMEITATRKE
jgi:hypothetical protein